MCEFHAIAKASEFIAGSSREYSFTTQTITDSSYSNERRCWVTTVWAEVTQLASYLKCGLVYRCGPIFRTCLDSTHVPH